MRPHASASAADTADIAFGGRSSSCAARATASMAEDEGPKSRASKVRKLQHQQEAMCLQGLVLGLQNCCLVWGCFVGSQKKVQPLSKGPSYLVESHACFRGMMMVMVMMMVLMIYITLIEMMQRTSCT